MNYIGDFNRFITSAKATARNSRELLAANNLALVPFLAKKFCQRKGTLVDWDLLTVGIDAIYSAATNFDTGRGCKFSTCACRYIWTAFLRSTAVRKKVFRAVPFSALPYEEVAEAMSAPEDHDAVAEHAEVINKLLATMQPRDAAMVQEYYLDSLSPTYEEIGARHGVSRKRVHQRLARGLKAARQSIESIS